MNRTRLTFYVILAVCLGILALSLAGQVVNDRTLQQLFVGASIFGVGVVALDMFGILGAHHGDAADFAGHDVGGHDFAGHDASGHDVGGHGGFGHDTLPAHDTGPVAAHAATGHPAGEQPCDNQPCADQAEAQHVAAQQHDQGGQSHEPNSQSAVTVLSVLSYLRMLVYFCLGFGPAGWAGMAAGWGPWRSLLLAVPVGAAALALARLFFRFQRRDTGATPDAVDMLHETGVVTVPLDATTMGKVRVQVGMSVEEPYALAADPGASFERGARVQIVGVSDDCVRVR